MSAMNGYQVGSLADFISLKPMTTPSKVEIKSWFGNIDIKTESEHVVENEMGKKRKTDSLADEDEMLVQKKKRKTETLMSENEMESSDMKQQVDNQDQNKHHEKKSKRKTNLILESETPDIENQVEEVIKKENRKKEKMLGLPVKGLEQRKIKKQQRKSTITRNNENIGSTNDEQDSTMENGKEHSKNKEKSKNMVTLDPEKESRSIFVGNVPCKTKIHKLKKLFSKYGPVDTIRYRCAAAADPKLPQKAAVIKQKFHPDRTNLVAYIRFQSLPSVELSLEMNNHVLDGHTLRVDRAVNSDKHDQKKAVFVGNVPFTAEEDELREVFADCGDIVGVRIVREKKTGMGKGFAYVNFETTDAVELALKKEGHNMKNRPLRVSRAVKKEVASKKGNKRIGRRPMHVLNRRNKRADKTEKFSFQGETTADTGKTKKKLFNKGDLKKSIIADMLIGGHKHKPRSLLAKRKRSQGADIEDKKRRK